jgi:spectinomycin phosphotransferase
MLEKPDLSDEKIVACLQTEYGLRAAGLAFLPIGADLNTAVYRAETAAGKLYFVKLRSGVFDETSVALPKFLHDRGIRQIIAPLPSGSGMLWAGLEAFKLILYPFVDGRNGYEIELSDRQWRQFGAALKRIHSLDVPPWLTCGLQRETYTPQWREMLKACLAQADAEASDEPVAQKLAAFLKVEREPILDLVRRAGRLAQTLQARPPESIVCHSDLHAGNLLIDGKGAIYIVDWDAPLLAPKERDLMFAGGGQFGARRTPQEEEALFYRGYGRTQVDPVALAYYRYERIVQDLAVECRQILARQGDGQDREQAFRYLSSHFLPGNVLAIARTSDKTPGSQP